MKKYLVLYTAPTEASRQMAETSPEEQAKGMEAWMQWAQRCGDKLVDLGVTINRWTKTFSWRKHRQQFKHCRIFCFAGRRYGRSQSFIERPSASWLECCLHYRSI